ncbi:cardiomyopathy-associated protein 5 [Halichoeres trimaculatus]|uniref:cardiomyopathy-associated protein 5 n=1 Tax=Halichoeres trimaculatus TaxID=147232 RepID=UPI003D9F78A1
MEECESLDSEMTELQEFQSEANSQDDEDEVEELRNSLREVVQDQSVQPKLQCLMVDPSFSMVTVQSEDSGIVWETASSRCSTPWASETSSTSEAYSMEGSGAAGKITIVFDEEKIVRRRTRSGGRSSRLGDRLSRPGSSRSASALGVERPEMAEVSLPNVKPEKTPAGPDLEEIRNKDQQLFSLISEGYEILNIRVPSKLPTVDEEESTELQDNLSYLDQTPKIRSKNSHDLTQQQNHFLPQEILDQKERSEQDSSESPTDAEVSKTPTPKDSTGDIDYFEKFTLLDVGGPGDQAPQIKEEAQKPAGKTLEEEQITTKEKATDSPSASEDSFVFVTDVEIVGEHLDEVFYGEGPPPRKEDEEAESGGGMRMRRESQRSLKGNGSVLFGSQETILTPIFISPGPPKIIDPILLEEPTAMSFMYSDLYEDAVGERRRSDEEYSEAESVASEKSYKRRMSDSEETEGYLEKFTLRDEIPAVEAQPELAEDKGEGRMMWSQNKFDMTGCLTRAVQEEDMDEVQMEPPSTEEISAEEKRKDIKPAVEEKLEEDKEREDIKLKEESFKESKSTDDQMEVHPLETQQVDSKTETTEDCEEQQREVRAETTEQATVAEQTDQTLEVAEKAAQAVVSASEETAMEEPVGSEVPLTIIESETTRESSEKSLSEETAADTKVVTSEDEVVTEAVTEEPEDKTQDKLTPCENETSTVTSLSKEKEAAVPVEVTTDCGSDVQAVVEVIEKAVDETEIQTQVQIDLKEVTNVQTAAAGEERREAEAETVESHVTESKTEADLGSGGKTEPDELKTDSDKKQNEILEMNKHQQEEKLDTEKSFDKTQLITEAKDETPAVETGSTVQEMVSVGDELIVFVPKGQAVEMDIEVSQQLEKMPCVTAALTELVETCQAPTAPESITEVQESLPAQNEEKGAKSQLEAKPEVDIKEGAKPKIVTEEEENTDIMIVEPGVVIEKEKPEIIVEEAKAKVIVEEAKPGVVVVEEAKPDVIVEEAKAEVIVEEAKAEVIVEEAQPEVIVEEAKAEVIVEEAKTKVVLEKVKSEIVVEEEKPEVVVIEEAKHEVTVEEAKAEVAFIEEAKPEVVIEEEKVEVVSEKVKPKVVVIKKTDVKPGIDVKEEEAQPTIVREISKPEIVTEKETKPKNEIGTTCFPSAYVEEANIEEQELEEDKGVFSRLRSFTPLEDLSELNKEYLQSEEPNVEQSEDVHEAKDVPEKIIVAEDTSPEIDLRREEEKQKVEQAEAVTEEAPEVTVEELEYEIITEQDAKEMPQTETQGDEEVPPIPGTVQVKEEKMKMDLETKEEAFDLSQEEELVEAGYEIIDEEEENQARLAAELQGMDWFCFSCGCLLSEEDFSSGEHHSHEVTAVDKAYEDIKEKLGDWISELQGRSENIEDLVSELELGYNSVEDQCVECEAAMQAQNDEMMALVMEQYNTMSISMEEEKKAKLEQLYDQIVSFQESIDSAKTTLETTDREAETDARVSAEAVGLRLKEALDSAMSLELGPRGLLVFEDYAKGNSSSSHLAQRKGIPVPQRPTLQPQEAGSASSTSVTVYWKVNAGDIIDCFQVYCMEDPQGAVSEEYRVTVKESYCVLEELEPDKTYKVWVMAVNYTGCSLPSERLSFRTAPSVPVIDTERCTVMWDSATLRWSSEKQAAEQSFILEYCRQYELEGEGLRTISGIRSCEQRVLLQPNENYLFYIKAVNEAGASEQSEAALISTKGTKFCLLKATAHPALELSVDETIVHFPQDTPENTPSVDKLCLSILGELLPCKGRYYWETVVSGSTAYRLGVASGSASRNSPLGENSLSWCLQCIPAPSGCRYQLLHNDVHSSVFVIDMPERVGTLLDYQLGHLSFYNAQTGQLLGAFCQCFTEPCHPALALELPGHLEVSMVPELPEFTRDS